jgi:hypothetical protein
LRLLMDRPAARRNGHARRLSRAARGAPQHGRRARGCARAELLWMWLQRGFAASLGLLRGIVRSAGTRRSPSGSASSSLQSCVDRTRLARRPALRLDHSARRLGGVWGAPRSDRQGGGRASNSRAAGREGLTARHRGRHGTDATRHLLDRREHGVPDDARADGRGVGVPRRPPRCTRRAAELSGVQAHETSRGVVTRSGAQDEPRSCQAFRRTRPSRSQVGRRRRPSGHRSGPKTIGISSRIGTPADSCQALARFLKPSIAARLEFVLVAARALRGSESETAHRCFMCGFVTRAITAARFSTSRPDPAGKGKAGTRAASRSHVFRCKGGKNEDPDAGRRQSS